MSSLDNPSIERFRLFRGPVNRTMPLLLSGKNETGEVVDVSRVPMSTYDFMKRFVEVFNLRMSAPSYLRPAYDKLLNTLENNYPFTGDGAPRHSDGRMKVAPDAPYLRLLTPETGLVNGAVDLSDGYASLVGEEFTRAIVDKYCGMPWSRSDTKENPVWLALARRDKALLAAFVDARFSRATERFGYDGKMMRVYAPPVPKEGAAGRLWVVSGLVGGIYDSGVLGSSHLDGHYNLGWLVGEAPETQRAAAGQLRRTLEQRV